MQSEHSSKSSIDDTDRRHVSTEAARLTLADVAGIDRTVASGFQEHGFVLPVDIRYASVEELTTVPGVDRAIADKIKSTVVADSC